MEYLLFVAYLVFFAWVVTRVRFFNRAGLSKSQLIIIFLLKIIAGIFYGWIGLYYGELAQMQDTWAYHLESVQQHHLLFDDPGKYLTDLFHNPYNESGIGSPDYYWRDLRSNTYIKIVSVFNIFSFCNYYVNVIFYEFITLFGSIALYQVMIDNFRGRKLSVLIATFLVPSFLYWTSGLHKEGLIFTGISFLVYCIYFGTKEKRFGIARILCILAGLLIIFVLRSFVMMTLIPALICWILSIRFPKKVLPIFVIGHLLFAIFFFSGHLLHPRLDFMQSVINKRSEFVALVANSSLPMGELKPTFWSFIQSAPEAIDLTMLRPHPGEVRHILSLAAMLEIDILLLLFILFLFFRSSRQYSSRPLIFFCVFFSFTWLMAIGYTVNNIGAIVRYRSIVMPLLVIPAAAQVSWERIGRFLGKIKIFINIK